MPLISLCIIARNEESVLGRCLDSVADLVDEIILVDTGSTDRTKAAAAEYAAKIYDFPWCDDFRQPGTSPSPRRWATIGCGWTLTM